MFLFVPDLKAAPLAPDFAAFDRRAQSGERLNVVFFGGSLTWGAQSTDPQWTSYRARLIQKLEAAYPQAHFYGRDSAIGGTGSQLGAFRLERDVLAHKPDLVFLDFTINDGAYDKPDSDRLASYESLIRRMVQAGIPVIQVVLPAKRDVLPDPPARPLDAPHKQIGHEYGLPLADAVALVQERVRSGSITPDELWDMPPDVTHPGDKGYAAYADAAWSAYQEAVKNKIVCRLPEKMLFAETYMALKRHRLSGVTPLPAGWKTGKPSRNGAAFDFVPSRWMDELAIAKRGKEAGEQPAPFVFKIQAQNILLWGEGITASGKYSVRIDGGEAKTYDSGVHSKTATWRYVEMIAQGLDPAREHTVEIAPQLEPGQELRLESVCVAGAPAQISPVSALTNAAPSQVVPAPTLQNVAYGNHERQTLDFWKAPSSKPVPVLFYIHGGGWLGGDKSAVAKRYEIDRFLAQGISVVSINYRYLKQTILTDESIPLPVITADKVAGEDPPVKVPLHDAARALQFVRSKAGEWNIDKDRIGATGESAGACSALWLAYHKDMADPANSDPIARESTRLWCAAVLEAQTTLDPQQMKDWTPNSQYGGHAFGFAWNPKLPLAEFQEFLKHRQIVLPWIEQYSPYALATAGAPPVYLFYGSDAPAFGEAKKDPTHTANFGAILLEKTKRLGVECELVYPGAPGITHENAGDYLIDKLKSSR